MFSEVGLDSKPTVTCFTPVWLHSCVYSAVASDEGVVVMMEDWILLDGFVKDGVG